MGHQARALDPNEITLSLCGWSIPGHAVEESLAIVHPGYAVA